MKKSTDPINIFIAYSRKDIELLEDLRNSLKILNRMGLVGEVWYDGLIEAGDEWEVSIKNALLNADIILLLISSDFISSDYCYNVEMVEALKLHEQGKTKVVPLLLRDCLWERTHFSKLQALPKNGKPILSEYWNNKDIPLKQVYESIIEIINNIKDNILKIEEQERHKQFKTLINQGDTFYNLEEWEKSRDSYNEALRLCESHFIPDQNYIKEKIADCTTKLLFITNRSNGIKYFNQNDFFKAVEYITLALDIKEDELLIKLKKQCENNIGSLGFNDFSKSAMEFFKNNDYITAINYFEKAFELKIPKEWKKYQIAKSKTDEKVVIKGLVEIRQIFKISKVGKILGIYVISGNMRINCKALVKRESIPQFVTEVISIKRFKDDVKEITAGYEAGILLNDQDNIEIGDIIECY
jgi:tetratricopeptide (TPR) repeat protein